MIKSAHDKCYNELLCYEVEIGASGFGDRKTLLKVHKSRR